MLVIGFIGFFNDIEKPDFDKEKKRRAVINFEGLKNTKYSKRPLNKGHTCVSQLFSIFVGKIIISLWFFLQESLS